MKSYCVKEKKQTECVKPSGYHMTAKNGRKYSFEVHLRFLRNQKNHNDIKSGMDKTPKKLDAPPQAGGERAQQGGEMSLSDLAGYAGKAGKKAAEMGRFFASEWLREPGAQQMLIGKVNPFLKKGIDQLSTAIRPKKPYKTNQKRFGWKWNFWRYALWI